MSVNKVQLANGETIIDISDSTVTPETLAEGVTAHDASGQKITGKMVPGGGKTVQTDWNQTDETAPDFLKNKPFYEAETETTIWKFDPLCDFIVVDGMTAYNMGNLTLDHFTNGISLGEYDPITGDILGVYDITETFATESIGEGCYALQSSELPAVIFVAEQDTDIGGGTILPVGAWLVEFSPIFSLGDPICFEFSTPYLAVNTVLLPEKFLPDISGRMEPILAYYQKTEDTAVRMGEGTYSTVLNYLKNSDEGPGEAAGHRAVSQNMGCSASGDGSHAEGYNTSAVGALQHVQGEWNIEDTELPYESASGDWVHKKRGRYAHIVGNGTGLQNRSNAHTLDWEGNAWYAGSVEGTSMILKSSGGKRFNVTVDDSGVLTATEITE